MIALDTNILVYASRSETQFHEAAVRLLTQISESPRPWAIPWPCVYEYLRVVTHPRLFSPPSTQTEALERLHLLRQSPSLSFIGPGPSHLGSLVSVAESSGAKGNLFCDAQIAALCREHGITEILTMDRDFNRFPGVKVRHPF